MKKNKKLFILIGAVAFVILAGLFINHSINVRKTGELTPEQYVQEMND